MLDGIGKGLDIWAAAMVKKTSAGRGSNGKTTAYGVKKLRELILELAVRGKLVPQDEEDDSAATLLQHLKDFKLDNPLEGRRGRSKEKSEEPELDPICVPPTWMKTKIGDVLYVIRGASPRPKGDPNYFSEIRTSYHWVKISDIRKHGVNGLLMDTDEFLTEAGMCKSVLLPKGTLILTNSATIGVPIVTGIEGCCIHDGYLAFPNFPEHLLNQRFFLYLLHELKEHAERSARGLAQLNLNTNLVRSFPLPLPPLAEQHRIVAKVDELMALCDALESEQSDSMAAHEQLVECLLGTLTDAEDAHAFGLAWRRIADHFDTLFTTEHSIDQLKQCILQLAVMGKLVPQDPEDEPAKVLNLQAEGGGLDVGWGGSPPGWTIAPLEFVSDKIVDCPHSTPKWTDRGKICVRTTQFSPGKLDLSAPRYVSESTFSERIQRLRPEHNDILYSREGGILGIACRIPAGVELCLGQRMMLIRAERSLNPEYLEMVLNSPLITDIARHKTTGGAAPRVNVSTVKAYPIPTPPLAEQHRIVARVDELMALCDGLKERLNAAQATQVQLADAVVAQALA